MDLTPEQLAAVEIVRAGKVAWTFALAFMRRGVTPETLVDLVALGIFAEWETSSFLAWTFTPWAAKLFGLEIDERVEMHHDASGEWAAEEIPHWVELGKASAVTRIPKRARTYSLPFPDLVPDPLPIPDVLIDPETDEPVTLFGLLVRRDPRLKPARPKKPAKRRAKRAG